MKVFSREKYINDPKLLLFYTKEQLKSEKWVKQCDGKPYKNGFVQDNEGRLHEISESWTIEKKYRYYFILEGISGYRAYFLKSTDEPEYFTKALTMTYNQSYKVNELLNRVDQETEYFRDVKELTEHLSESVAEYIYIFENDQWDLFKREMISGMMEQLKIKINN